MSFHQKHTIRDVMISQNGENSKQVNDFKYLGSPIESMEHDINVRIGQSWATYTS